MLEISDKVSDVIASLREVEVECAELSAKNQASQVYNQAVGFEVNTIQISKFTQRK